MAMGLRAYDDLLKATKTDIDALIQSLDPNKATLKEYLTKMTLKDWLRRGEKKTPASTTNVYKDIGLLGDREPPQNLKWTKMKKHMLTGTTAV